MQTAEVVLGVLRERGRKGLPCMQLYRQMFNKDLYLLAYGNIYSNSGAMTPGAGSPYLTGVPPIRPLRPAHPDPVGCTYGALAAAPLLATVRDPLQRGSLLACRAVRVVAMRTRRAWFCGLANPRAFLATSLAVRVCASAFAFE